MKYSTAIFLSLLFLTGCNMQHKQKSIMVTIQPQKYLVEAIVGDDIEVTCMVPAGNSPESYDPTPSHLVKVSKSDLYFKIGYIGFEMAWMNKLAENNPNLRIVDCSKGIKLINTTACCCGNSEHAIHFQGIDPHTWTSPHNVKIMIETIYQEVVKLTPQYEKKFAKRKSELLAHVTAIDELCKEKLTPLSGMAFVIYHPSLTYLAQDYGLQQIAIETDGKEPSVSSMRHAIDEAKKNKIKVLFLQKEFNHKSAELFAQELGCPIVMINPLNYNWEEEMLHVINSLAQCAQ